MCAVVCEGVSAYACGCVGLCAFVQLCAELFELMFVCACVCVCVCVCVFVDTLDVVWNSMA